MGIGSSVSCLGRRHSGASGNKRSHGDVFLCGTELKFSRDQLSNLNVHFARLDHEGHAGQSHDFSRDRARAAAEVVVERLVQRLVCGAGTLDSRFASKFLVTLDNSRERNKSETRPKFEYLVRLDALSTPAIYPEDSKPTCRIVEGAGEGVPQGYGKIRVQGEGAEDWAEFISPGGFLRRDRVQERFVELLARAAAGPSPPHKPEDVDESRLCGSPGKIVDAGLLHEILQLAPEGQVFYGPAESNRSRFPDPRDFRIAIVEGSPVVRLRIGFLSPALAPATGGDVEVKLVLAIGFQAWPQSCDFPARVPLGHIDCLLFQQAAQTGFYMVPSSPHPTVRCDDRSCCWQMWVPAAELTLLTHYSGASAPARVLTVLRTITAQLRGRKSRQSLGGFGLPATRDQPGLKVVSSYMLKTFYWFEVENSPGVISWGPEALSSHVIKILDALMIALRTQRFRSYFFPWCNIMLREGFSEEDYQSDAALLEAFLKRIHETASEQTHLSGNEAEDWSEECRKKMQLETLLIQKWGNVLSDLAPRFSRFSFSQTSLSAGHYSRRQLDYIGHVLREMLRVRAITLHAPGGWLLSSVSPETNQQDDAVDDLIYIVALILEQVKDSAAGFNTVAARKRHRKKHHGKPSEDQRFNVQYDAFLAELTSCIRQDVELSIVDLTDDCVLVRQVLKWLYHAQEDRFLAPHLRPYLNRLFAASHENGWYLEEWRRREKKDELKALGSFLRLLHKRDIGPAEGLSDAAGKGWLWAGSMMKTAKEVGGIHLLMTPSAKETLRFDVHPDLLDVSVNNTINRMSFTSNTLPTNTIKTLSGTLTVKNRTSTIITQEDLTLRLQRAPATLRRPSYAQPPHSRLRDGSPLTLVLDARRRYGQQRGLGNLVQALISLEKFSILQEVSALLPEDERQQVLDAIQKISKARRLTRRRRSSGVNSSGGRKDSIGSAASYKPCSALETLPETEDSTPSTPASEQRQNKDASTRRSSILGSCRAARRQQNSLKRHSVTGFYNGPFFSSPESVGFRNVGLLQLTEDRELQLRPLEDVARGAEAEVMGNGRKSKGRKRDVVTKL